MSRMGPSFEGRPRSGVILATTSERSTNSCREKYSFRFLGPVAVATEGTNADYSKKISQCPVHAFYDGNFKG